MRPESQIWAGADSVGWIICSQSGLYHTPAKSIIRIQTQIINGQLSIVNYQLTFFLEERRKLEETAIESQKSEKLLNTNPYYLAITRSSCEVSEI